MKRPVGHTKGFVRFCFNFLFKKPLKHSEKRNDMIFRKIPFAYSKEVDGGGEQEGTQTIPVVQVKR